MIAERRGCRQPGNLCSIRPYGPDYTRVTGAFWGGGGAGCNGDGGEDEDEFEG